MIRFAVPGVLLFSIVGCGGAPSGATVNAASDSTAAAAAKASEPRTSDPTAARPPTLLKEPSGSASGQSGANAAKFGNLGMTGATSATAPTADPSQASNSSKPKPTKISARHVLIQWMGAEKTKDSVVRSKEQALTLAKEVLRRARAKEDFARLAVEYSDEPNAGQRGGSLGRFGHGQMVPEFEAAAFKLEVGEISDIVESPFGFHVIQRTE